LGKEFQNSTFTLKGNNNHVIYLQIQICGLGFRIQLKKSGTRTPRVELEEIGPSFDLVKRRVKLASDDLWKRAVKKPKTLKVRVKVIY
jgi:ribosome production factor 2